MIDQSGMVLLNITQEKSGLYTATSPHLEGVYLAHRDLQAIIEDVPNVIKLWFKSNRNMDVEVFSGPVSRQGGNVKMSVIQIPAEIAAQALQA